jgi:hypothetical protein
MVTGEGKREGAGLRELWGNGKGKVRLRLGKRWGKGNGITRKGKGCGRGERDGKGVSKMAEGV